MSLAPIVLFVYNRPQHTLRTLEALSQNKLADESVLYVFADGAKENADENTIKRIEETKKIVNSKEWCKKIIFTESPTNKGLANSIIDGVSKVVKEHKRVIVLEDDLVTSPYFLKYMNDALDLYDSEESVACISGYIYPVKDEMPDTFFIKGADCWGWATWDRAWSVFEKDGKKLLDELKNKSLCKEFDFNNSYPFTQMLKDQIEGKNNSWAVRWYAATFLKNMFCLYPGKSLVQNIGFDGSGVHSSNSQTWKVQITNQPIVLSKLPIRENESAKKNIIGYFNSIKPSKLYYFKAWVKKYGGLN